MGIVRKQSIRSSVFIYLGFAVGAFNFWLLPHILSTEQFGLVRVLISVCTLLAGLCSLGMLPVITRFYPYYETKDKKHKTDLLTWVLVISLVGFIIMVILTRVFKEVIIRKFAGNSALFLDYFYLIYPFTFFILLFGIYERIAWSRQVTVISSFLRETGVRIFTLIIVVILALNWIGFTQFINLYSLQFAFVFFILFFYLTFKKKTRLDFRMSETTKQLYKKMGTYATYIFGGSIFILIEQYFNTIILGSRAGLTTAGIFDIANFIATLLLVPKRSLQGAAAATIARAWKENDTDRINRVYQKSTATLFIVGLLILGLIWLNIDHIFDLYKPEYRSGKYVVLFIGLANLVDLATGLNYDILVNSRLWRLNFVTSVALIAFFLPVTYIFVRHFGMMGSAYAIFISISLYNIVRCFILWWKYKMNPFTLKTVYILLSGLAAYFMASWLVPEIQSLFLDAAVRSLVFFIILAACVLRGKLSEDVTELFHLGLAKINPRSLKEGKNDHDAPNP